MNHIKDELKEMRHTDEFLKDCTEGLKHRTVHAIKKVIPRLVHLDIKDIDSWADDYAERVKDLARSLQKREHETGAFEHWYKNLYPQPDKSIKAMLQLAYFEGWEMGQFHVETQDYNAVYKPPEKG